MSTSDPRPLFLAGRWAAGGAGPMAVENPATEEPVAHVATASSADVESAVGAAVAAQRAWASVPAGERAELLTRAADLLDRDADELARLVVAEVGKPIAEARGEVGAAAGFCRFFAGLATTTSGEILPSAGTDQELWVRRLPQGVVGAIIPWNFPLALTARKIAPALVTGNAVVLKPAELTPLTALAFAERAEEAGVPAGLLSVLPGEGPTVGAALVARPEVAFVTMTGSVRAGREILKSAADRIVPVSLELGGKAPFVVFADADLDAAADAAVASRIMNCGQACVCNERTYVQAEVHDAFVERLAERMTALRVGDPMADTTQVGPKVSGAERDKVRRMVDDAVAAGARPVVGGEVPKGADFARGHWYQPTLLTGVPADAALLRTEVFGPVLPVVPFADEAEALRLANDSDYGLSAYLYTNDFGRVMRFTGRLEFGEVFVNRDGPEEVNGFHGGWGLSGLGGDDGRHGLDLYQRKQSVYVSW